MARQRKNISNDSSRDNSGRFNHEKNSNRRTSDEDSETNQIRNNKNKTKGNSYFGIKYWKSILGVMCLTITLYFCYLGYLETRVNTPFDEKKMVTKSGLDIKERYWGSYRPGVYFGLKTRDPYSLVSGLMWYSPKKITTSGAGFRHWCEQNDNLKKYGWLKHDGENFGVQEIYDETVKLTTSFVKNLSGHYGGDWTARIEITSLKPTTEEISLIWYTAIEKETEGHISPSDAANRLITGVRGHTSSLGSFSIKMYNISGKIGHESYLSTYAPGLNKLTEVVLSSLRLKPSKKTNKNLIVLPGKLFPPQMDEDKPNFIATQITVHTPFTLDVVFESESNENREDIMLTGDKYSKELKLNIDNFDEKFESIFNLKQNNYSQQEIDFAQAAFSNMIGGIGYFYGNSRVQSQYTKDPVPYWKAPLYTAVPSRSFFPRGFLWDEGFHGFLISTWDLNIQFDIINHWMDLMNVEGWIPREQILGPEALSKVPEEFVIQRNTNANPPTFFLTIRYILNKFSANLSQEHLDNLERLLPRLEAWFNWFNSTQKGETGSSYRWRGRDSKTNRELNPKTLTSGLDDYPRASHPTDLERHLDLRCWMAMASSVLTDLCLLFNREEAYKYANTFDLLSNNALLDQLHWSNNQQRFSDYGLHTDSVVLRHPKRIQKSHVATLQNIEKIRVVLKDPEYRFVDTTFGYVSLYPFLLQILEPDSPKLGVILKDLKKPNLLWTKFGLRSLAKDSPLYNQWNTEHDPPYWRGAIWMNMNFLAVSALNYYSTVEGPFRDKAYQLKVELKNNLVKNLFNQYLKTGYLWEHYNDVTGVGEGCRPFNGWSALIVLLMSGNI